MGETTVHLTTSGTFEQGIRVSARAGVARFLLALGNGRRWEEKEASLTGDALLTYDAAKSLSGVAVSAVKLKTATGGLDGDAALDRKGAKWSFKAHAGGGGDVGRLAHLVQLCLGSQGAAVSGTWQLDASADGTIGQSVKATVKGQMTDLAFTASSPAAAQAPDESIGKVDVAAEARYESGPSDRLILDRLDVAFPSVFLKASGAAVFPGARQVPQEKPPAKGVSPRPARFPWWREPSRGRPTWLRFRRFSASLASCPRGSPWPAART